MSYQALLPFIHVSHAYVSSILTQGYRPGAGNRDSAAANRQSIERAWAPSYSDAEVAPSYGALGTDCFDTKADVYGNVAIEMRASVLEKSTVCVGDSIIKGERPAQHEWDVAQAMYARRGQEFVEFQCWLELNRMDIQAIWVKDTVSNIDEIVAAADGIPVYQYKLDYETFSREWVLVN